MFGLFINKPLHRLTFPCALLILDTGIFAYVITDDFQVALGTGNHHPIIALLLELEGQILVLIDTYQGCILRTDKILFCKKKLRIKDIAVAAFVIFHKYPYTFPVQYSLN